MVSDPVARGSDMHHHAGSRVNEHGAAKGGLVEFGCVWSAEKENEARNTMARAV